ncbi:hypothetical protein, partial [Escherichia coli]|uniref:hypothetical protein n=1 Tax=Escherichia coli TaxID=562 RepID=UPI003D9A502C
LFPGVFGYLIKGAENLVIALFNFAGLILKFLNRPFLGVNLNDIGTTLRFTPKKTFFTAVIVIAT